MDNDDYYPAGRPLSTQLSSSLYTYRPNTLQAYRSVLKIYQIGWLLIQVNTSHRWDRKWAELKDGVFRYADSEENKSTSIFIPIENIIRLVTKNDLIVMKTKNEKLQMKTEIPSEIGNWTFSFQKSVALALMKIREQGQMSALVSHEDYTHSIGVGTRQRQRSEDWSKEEFGGQGHGIQSQINRTRIMMAGHASSIADARHTFHVGSHESADDSLTVMVERGRGSLDTTREHLLMTAMRRPHTPPRTAPTSPLKMNFHPNSCATTPERHGHYHHDDCSSLGLTGDVVLPDAPLNMSERNISGASDPDTSGGGMQTWRSVEELSALGGEANEPKCRSRGTSQGSSDPFPFDDEEIEQPPFESIQLCAGSHSLLGPRSKNEDRCVAVTNLYAEVNDFMSSPSNISFYGADRGANWRELTRPIRVATHSDAYFAVYDGHSGSAASQFLSHVLHHSIYTHPLFETDLEAAISDTCINIDRQFLEQCRARGVYDGTTAVGALVTNFGSRLTVFNIGDSEAVLYRDGEVIELTSKHSPNREDERSRILSARGWITEEKELYYGRLHRMDLKDEYILEKANDLQWTYIYRVCGEISVSRSIGDIPYKGFAPGQIVNEPFLWPADHNQIFSADLVIPHPEFVSVTLNEKDDFMILASDGLWDVVQKHEACIRVRDSLSLGKSPQEISEELSDFAFRLGSSDNITVVIVQFIHN